MIVRERGLFVIIDAPDLGIVIHWDKGTRVYVKVDPRWKDRVRNILIYQGNIFDSICF